ncbi:hypothetical protein [Pectinatus sottacetonis]|uniref:hypothetical protein n=1 Tax=Pectinatus sottacetonis TaxID=1002795 RepID=UPI0018C7ED33|nr:hypothetical protein [Pectinatus sottacetonis]
MKYYNAHIWEVFLNAIEKISQIESLNITNIDTLKGKCVSLAYYDALNDHSKYQTTLYKEEQDGDIFNSYFFIIAAKHLLLIELIDNDESKKSIRIILEKLHNYLGNNYYFYNKPEIIKKLILYGNMFKMNNIYLEQDKYIIRIAESARYLREKGIELSIKKGCIDFCEQKVFELLDKKVAGVGGINSYVYLFEKFIRQLYIPKIDRYLISRTVNKERNEPINLLMQLSGRHLQDSPKCKLLDTLINEEIVSIARALLDIKDVSGESSFEYACMDIRDFTYYLNSELHFDKICIPMQYSKKFILKSLDYLIEPWFSHAYRKYCYRDYKIVAEYVLSLKLFNGFINESDMKKQTHIAKYKINQILEDISIPVYSVNKNYTSVDAPTNLFSKPLIYFPKRGYYMIDQHFSGIGFYFSIYNLIKSHYASLDKEQGDNVEKILKDEMTSKGYAYGCGEYPSMNNIPAGQCDLVINENELYFFEIKKRSIMNEFNNVDDVALLASLGMGMIRAQKQAFAHELYLKENQQLSLNNGNYIINFDHNKFPARKISVCFSEYSYLTSKTFSKNLLEILLIGEFKTADANKQSELYRLNCYGNELKNIVNDIYDGIRHRANEVTFGSLFCSLQQILTALWCTNTETEFMKIIDRWTYFQDKTLDPYVSIVEHLYTGSNLSNDLLQTLKRNHQKSILIR